MDIEFTLDGEAKRCPEGFTVTGALFHLGRPMSRVTSRLEQPRALFCGMGICCECLMEIDGRPSVRACVTLVKPGMAVVTRRGDAELPGGETR